MRILYVEDNPANLFLIKRVAKMGEHEVINLIDGEEALRKIDIIKPDLILMDIQLAGQLTGLDVVRKLRSTGYSMPIVAVTAYAMVGDRERCLEAGCNEYLSKPLPIGRVVELLQLYQSGVPADAPVNDDDSSVSIPILTRLPGERLAPPLVETILPPAAPAIVDTPPVADSPLPAAETQAANASPADASPVADSPLPAAETQAADASSSAAPATPDVSVPDSMASQPPASESASDAVVLPVNPDAEGLKSAVDSLPTVELGTDVKSHPAIEPTSQDTSHPQDTVQAS